MLMLLVFLVAAGQDPDPAPLLKKLSEGDWDTQAVAAMELVKMGPRVADAVRKAKEGAAPGSDLDFWCERILKRLEVAERIEQALERLEKGTLSEQIAAAEELIQIGPAALPRLREAARREKLKEWCEKIVREIEKGAEKGAPGPVPKPTENPAKEKLLSGARVLMSTPIWGGATSSGAKIYLCDLSVLDAEMFRKLQDHLGTFSILAMVVDNREGTYPLFLSDGRGTSATPDLALVMDDGRQMEAEKIDPLKLKHNNPSIWKWELQNITDSKTVYPGGVVAVVRPFPQSLNLKQVKSVFASPYQQGASYEQVRAELTRSVGQIPVVNAVWGGYWVPPPKPSERELPLVQWSGTLGETRVILLPLRYVHPDAEKRCRELFSDPWDYLLVILDNRGGKRDAQFESSLLVGWLESGHQFVPAQNFPGKDYFDPLRNKFHSIKAVPGGFTTGYVAVPVGFIGRAARLEMKESWSDSSKRIPLDRSPLTQQQLQKTIDAYSLRSR